MDALPRQQRLSGSVPARAAAPDPSVCNAQKGRNLMPTKAAFCVARQQENHDFMHI
jgi:hypothetical protein